MKCPLIALVTVTASPVTDMPRTGEAVVLALTGRGAYLFSAVQQKNTNDRMALQLIQYLDRRTFECRFAQFDGEATSILFLNATLCDQGRYPNRS